MEKNQTYLDMTKPATLNSKVIQDAHGEMISGHQKNKFLYTKLIYPILSKPSHN
jgi:hypothetical protein